MHRVIGMGNEVTLNILKAFPSGFTVDCRLQYPLGPATVLILFGASGSGKTTILRCLAGLEWPDRGTIRFNSHTWLDTEKGIRVPPQARHLGFMSQDYALFPPYTVAGNISYGLHGLNAMDRERRVQEVVALLRLQGLEDQKPAQLSGGQQQRVALARALAPKPQLLLLDEPLSALDAPTRVHLRGELRTLLHQQALPSVIVTHDWSEALALGDLIAVIDKGSVLQTGEPMAVFSRPANADVARVVGIETVVRGTIVETRDGLATVQVGAVRLTALNPDELGPEVFVCIRAEDVVLEQGGPSASSARNHLKGIITGISPLGALARVTINCGFALSATVTRSAVMECRLGVGGVVVAAMKAGALHLVPRDGSRESKP
ncbi:MAG: ABC transporter ATP-binding protein [Nitrospiraceae bacterium]|nr:ABC transporter ATP-binding protein [Nitrospiraceae bacterium]